MKNRVVTNSFRTIKKNIARFLSLMVMSFLAAFTFNGINSTEPDFIYSIDKFYDDHNHYDIKIYSDMGMSKDDVPHLKNVNNVLDVEGVYSVDKLINIGQIETVVNVSSLTYELNNIDVIEGRLPTKNNEIVVEENLLLHHNLAIGDTLTITDDNLTIDSFEIVGTVTSSLYINNIDLNQERGNTSIGVGIINYYTYVLDDAFDQDYFNYIYLTIDGAQDLVTSRDEYNALVNKVIDGIEDIKLQGESRRLDEIIIPLYQEIEEKELEGLAEFNKAKLELDDAKSQLDSAKETIDKMDVNSPFYTMILNRYNEGLIEYNNALNEYNENYETFINEINEAYEKVDSIKLPTWYINERIDDVSYREYIEDAQSVANLAKAFPIVFFIVATLISLISMSRLVEDERNEIGTMKSLGFSNVQIMGKYLYFAFIATIIGGLIGCVTGAYVLPTMILGIYGILFDVPTTVLKIDFITSSITILLSCLCIVGATLFTAMKVLKEKPAELMRPKAPKKGKRVFLEKFPFIWNKINFSNKITIRNISRYKKRVFATIFGIMGCTALMMSGFGLKDSLVDLPNKQFNDIFKFDTMVFVNDYNSNEDKSLFEYECVKEMTDVQVISATTTSTDVNLFVVEDNESLDKFINLYEIENYTKVFLEEGKVVISDKLAQIKNVKIGDEITFKDANNVSSTYVVSSIIEMYFEHYAFISRPTYESKGFEYSPNSVYLQTYDLTKEEQDNLTMNLLENDKILTVQFIDGMVENVNNMLKSLDQVIVILIVLAALLAFVVLYNLSNINIHERKREIATLKVLGFYNKEVDAYITKENIILTLIGVALGLVFGYFLSGYIISTVEIEKARFIHNVKYLSYIYSTILSFVFTFIVNGITHFSLKKIDMIESLKSVE